MINVGSIDNPFINTTDSKIITRVTSYEIFWATAHTAPVKAYLNLRPIQIRGWNI